MGLPALPCHTKHIHRKPRRDPAEGMLDPPRLCVSQFPGTAASTDRGVTAAQKIGFPVGGQIRLLNGSPPTDGYLRVVFPHKSQG